MQSKWYQPASWINPDTPNSNSAPGNVTQPQANIPLAEAARESRTPSANPGHEFAAEYTARISHSLDEIAREKENFRKWQTKKQQGSHRIAEAVALCVIQGAAKPATGPMAPFRELAAAGDPAFAHRR